MNVNQPFPTDVPFDEAEKLKLSCRLCLAPEQDIPLYSPYQESIMYVEVLQLLADVQILSTDCLPKKICMECASKLVLFYKFRKKIELSQTTLTATLATPMKMEEFDDKDGIQMIEETVEIDDHEDDGRSDDISDGMYERGFIELDDVIEESYEPDVVSNPSEHSEPSNQHSGAENELCVVDVVGAETMYVAVEPKKIKTQKKQHHQCDECGRVFTRKTVLDQHKNTHTGIKNFSCDICRSLFTRRSHLAIHMRIHEDSKPYICEICSRGFRKSGDLARHRRIHFSDRNYPCSMCEKRFKRATDVTSHMRTHTKDKPYKCKHPKCDKKYSSHSSLRKHEIRKHEKHLPDSAINKLTMYQIEEVVD